MGHKVHTVTWILNPWSRCFVVIRTSKRTCHLVVIAGIPSCYPHILPKQQCTLQWRHNGHDGVSNHQPHHCLLNHLFRRRSKKISKLRVNGLCAWNSPVTGELSAQRENVSIWLRHHGLGQSWLNARTTVPTFSRRWANLQCCMGCT